MKVLTVEDPVYQEFLIYDRLIPGDRELAKCLKQTKIVHRQAEERKVKSEPRVASFNTLWYVQRVGSL